MVKIIPIRHLLILITAAIILFILFIFSSGSVTQAANSPENTTNVKTSRPEYESNVILAKLSDSASKTVRSKLSEKSEKKIDFAKTDADTTGLAEIDSLAKAEKFEKLEPVIKDIEDQDGPKKELARWYSITLQTEHKVVKEGSEEFNKVDSVAHKLQEKDIIESAGPSGLVHAEFTPNDTYYASNQYAPQIIQADRAWDITMGATSVVLAILDTGIKNSHADLSGRVIGAYDFTGSPYWADDVHGHGTHVAGIAAANINNSTGIAGVAPGVSLLNVKVIRDGGTGSETTISNGIVWAADNGADVINMSLGGDYECSGSSWGVVANAIDYAYYTKGVVVVAVAGNSGVNDVHMPGNCNNVISVAATDSSDAKASYSNYGTAVDIAAPGGTIANGIYSLGLSGYAYNAGTSMASPHVAAVVALVRSANSTLTATASANIVLSNADNISGTGTYWSNGRVNADKAVWATISHPSSTPIYRAAYGSEHMWTASLTEYNALVAGGWTGEGTAFYGYTSSQPGTIPIYRAEYGGTHMWTSLAEYNALVAGGWTGEGIAFYVYTSGHPGTTAIYRASYGAAHMWVGLAAYNALVAGGWTGEGLAWYGTP